MARSAVKGHESLHDRSLAREAEALNEPMEEPDQDDQGRERQHQGGRRGGPIKFALQGEEVRENDRERSDVDPGQYERSQQRVPIEHEQDYSSRRERGGGGWEHDAP